MAVRDLNRAPIAAAGVPEPAGVGVQIQIGSLRGDPNNEKAPPELRSRPRAGPVD